MQVFGVRSSIPCISSLLVVTFLSISASAALSLLCFGGPLGLLGIELGHPMSLSRVGCVLDVYLVKGSLCSTCCGIPLIFLCPAVLETYSLPRYAFEMDFLFDSISPSSVFIVINTFLSRFFTFKLHSFDSLVHPDFSTDSFERFLCTAAFLLLHFFL